MKYIRFTFFLMAISTLVIASCSKDSDDLSGPAAVNKVETLKATTEMSIAIIKMNTSFHSQSTL